jgi:virulence-associated protein VagC
MVILYPPRKGWKILERAIKRFTDDFMADRDQPPSEERKKL